MIPLKSTRCVFAAVVFLMLAGCKSKQDIAIDQAKKQAAGTGRAQQVVSVDQSGATTTTTVQPPAPGQTAETVTTTVSPRSGTPVGAPNATFQQGINPQAQQQAQGVSAPSYPGGPASAPAAIPTPGSNPVIRPADVNVAAGTPLTIRINQRISVKSTPAGSRFTGEVAEPVSGRNQQVIIPQGTRVEGIVDASHRRGHFKGSSLLELRLTSMELNGTRYPLDTHDLTRTKKGKGKRSAAFIGGGTGFGMLVGGVASGGVGLLVGGLAGAGAGTAIGGLTGNRDIDIPSESIVRFRLADDLVIQQ